MTPAEVFLSTLCAILLPLYWERRQRCQALKRRHASEYETRAELVTQLQAVLIEKDADARRYDAELVEADEAREIGDDMAAALRPLLDDPSPANQLAAAGALTRWYDVVGGWPADLQPSKLRQEIDDPEDIDPRD